MIEFESRTGTASNGATVEVGTVLFEGKRFEALGAVVDEANGMICAYVSPVKEKPGTFALTTWEGKVLCPLVRRGAWMQRGFNGSRFTVYAWSCTYQGKVYSGRNAGPQMFVRMRAGKVASS